MFKNFVYTLLDFWPGGGPQPDWHPAPTLNNAVNNSTVLPPVEGLPGSTIAVLVIAGLLIVGLTVFFLIKNKKKNGDDKS